MRGVVTTSIDKGKNFASRFQICVAPRGAMEADVATDVWDDFGQKVDLTARLREILLNYPEGASILKELLQNAVRVVRVHFFTSRPCRPLGPRADDQESRGSAPSPLEPLRGTNAGHPRDAAPP